ncbi:hypothetical protein HDU93_008903 [Gonapodya sp. JEL0774]|nr:hypothetical protein HDU93_008903 [Gonapodya sp. JEL0774]
MAVPLVIYGFLLLVALAAYVWIKYPNRAVGTRDCPNIPTVDGSVPVLGGMLTLAKAGPWLYEFLYEQALKKGEVFRITMPKYPNALDMIFISNVQDLEHILRDPWLYEKGAGMKEMNKDLFGNFGIFSNDGDTWKVQRKVASNIFNVKNFRDFYSPIFQSDALKLSSHLTSAAKMGAPVDLQDLLLRSTMDSFLKIAMGKHKGCLDGTPSVVDGKYVGMGDACTLPQVEFTTAFDTLNNIVAQRFSLPFWQLVEKLTGRHDKMEWCKSVLRNNAQTIIEEKRKIRAERGDSGPAEDRPAQDLLDYFLVTENEDGTTITDEQLQDVVINFVVAGRDTTAQTLSWVFYELARHPDILAKVRAECFSVLGKDRVCQYSDIKDLKYCNATFNEVLRYHANVPFNFKFPTKDDILPGTQTKVYAGQQITFSPWVMGRLERIWGPDAQELKPERWLDQNGNLLKENAYKWPVFHAGPRICLGMNMATQEALTILSTVVRKFAFQLVNEGGLSRSW